MQRMEKTRESIALADDKNKKAIRMMENAMVVLKGQKGDLRSAGENAKMTSESSGGKVKRINVKRLNKEQRKKNKEKLNKAMKKKAGKKAVEKYKKEQKQLEEEQKQLEESDDSDSD